MFRPIELSKVNYVFIISFIKLVKRSRTDQYYNFTAVQLTPILIVRPSYSARKYIPEVEVPFAQSSKNSLMRLRYYHLVK